MAPESGSPREVPADETIDVARLGDPDVVERREQVVSALVTVFRRMEPFLGERVCDAWDKVRRLEPEAAADIARVDARLGRVAVQVIDGKRPAVDLLTASETYVLFWQRAIAAVQLRELTCSRCHQLKESVAVRGDHLERLCLRCWKRTTG